MASTRLRVTVVGDSDFDSDFDKILLTISMLCSLCITSSYPLLVIIIHSYIRAFI